MLRFKSFIFVFLAFFTYNCFGIECIKTKNSVLIKINGKGDTFHSIFDKRYKKTLLKTVRDIKLLDDSSIIIATWGSGLYILDSETLKIKKNYQKIKFINALCLAKNNPNIDFIAANKGNIFIVNKPWKINLINTQKYKQGGIFHDVVFVNKIGIIAGSTGKGLLIFSEIGKIKEKIEKNINNSWINSLYFAPNSNFMKYNIREKLVNCLLIGGIKGLEAYDFDKNKSYKINSVEGIVNKIRFFGKKAIISTADNGVFLFAYNKWFHFRVNENNVFDAVVIKDYIYIASEKGIFSMNFALQNSEFKLIKNINEECRIIFPFKKKLLIGTKSGKIIVYDYSLDKFVKEKIL